MTMTLKQSDLYRFERLVSKLIKPSDNPMVCFIPLDGSLKLCAFSKDAMLTMHVNKEGFLDPFTMQWSDLKALAVGKKNVDITFNLTKDSVHVRCGEEQHWFSVSTKVNALPNAPLQTSIHPKVHLLDALNDAGRCVDKDSIKTALTGICLRGATSQIISTTRVQLLIQEGYNFTWGESDVIVHASKIFGSKELREIDTDEMLMGLVNEFVYFSIGAVEFWLRGIDGKFPKVDSIVKPAEDTTYLNIHPSDAKFILDRIDKLLGHKEHESPIHLSLDTNVWLRAYDQPQKTGIALELSGSTFTGKSASVSMNRLFLKNALTCGCHRIGIDPAGDKPVICAGEDKTFIFVPLTDASAPAAEHMDVIASSTQSAVTPKAPATAPAPVKRRRRTVKRDVVTPTGKAALLQSAEQLRNNLRDSLLQVNTLIREVKAQKQKDRLLKTTMDSLRKLSLA